MSQTVRERFKNYFFYSNPALVGKELLFCYTLCSHKVAHLACRTV